MGELCCSLKVNEEAVCSVCGWKGKSVPEKTLKSFLKEGLLSELNFLKGTISTPTQTAKSFASIPIRIFSSKKSPLKIRIGLKKKELPRSLCYCFSITREIIEEDIRTRESTDYPGYIKEKVRRHECECELKNHSGIYCLSHARKVIEEPKGRCEI